MSNKNDTTTFGMHLMLDAYNVPEAILDDMKLVYRFLYNVPEVINMTKLSTPLVVNADETAKGHDPGGISGVVLINESHISLHTFPKRGFFTLDVYSCNNFEKDVKKLMKYIKKTYPYKKHDLQIVMRGLEYPTRNNK